MGSRKMLRVLYSKEPIHIERSECVCRIVASSASDRVAILPEIAVPRSVLLRLSRPLYMRDLTLG